MSAVADTILANLEIVASERARRAADPLLARRVAGLKAFQQRRFSDTYSDLLSSSRYGATARFFLEQLYGPADFTKRDAQFARVVPALVRLFPQEVVHTVVVLSNLHALTELLDTAMANHASQVDPTPLEYAQAWKKTGRRSDRETQIASTVALATRLDTLTRSAILRKSLRLMRVPARAAGLEDLQRFLETGFDAFGAMGGAAEFIRTIESRERAFVSALFSADPRDGGSSDAGDGVALTQFTPAAARYAVPSSCRKGSIMPRKAKSKSKQSVEHDARALALDRLRSLARRYPKVTESLEFALEVGILAAEALRQIAIGVREGTAEVAHRRAQEAPAKGRARRAAVTGGR